MDERLTFRLLNRTSVLLMSNFKQNTLLWNTTDLSELDNCLTQNMFVIQRSWTLPRTPERQNIPLTIKCSDTRLKVLSSIPRLRTMDMDCCEVPCQDETINQCSHVFNNLVTKMDSLIELQKFQNFLRLYCVLIFYMRSFKS